ncbi:helix-turn-helix domain-containing protein [Altererythrobacter aurantiacus]|uniref:Helix-turn-helix domain-containing protein n=1 Tax=Parapontixanthobacter aurantiacus TaxID=1463599 RepID=A0A844ZHN7_9SPHN|nr:helix-turn-helix domain-containing protein [Parapontixanthobacter aurantiacus]
MARSGLGWSAKDLAANAKVGYATVARFESGGSINAESCKKLAATLRQAGAQFTHAKGRVGVSVPE